MTASPVHPTFMDLVQCDERQVIKNKVLLCKWMVTTQGCSRRVMIHKHEYGDDTRVIGEVRTCDEEDVKV